jgi:hypothetical protein
MDAPLFCRKTYDIFAGYRPDQSDDNLIAAMFNTLPKLVVSCSLTNPAWEGTTALLDLGNVRALTDRFYEIHLIGTGDLVRSLLVSDHVDG